VVGDIIIPNRAEIVKMNGEFWAFSHAKRDDMSQREESSQQMIDLQKG
jgi:hypothetical protein